MKANAKMSPEDVLAEAIEGMQEAGMCNVHGFVEDHLKFRGSFRVAVKGMHQGESFVLTQVFAARDRPYRGSFRSMARNRAAQMIRERERLQEQ